MSNCEGEPAAVGALVVTSIGLFLSVFSLVGVFLHRNDFKRAVVALILQRLFVLIELASLMWSVVVINGGCNAQASDFNRALVALFSLTLIFVVLDLVVFTLLFIALVAVISRVSFPLRDAFERCFDPESIRALREVGIHFLGEGRYPSQFPEVFEPPASFFEEKLENDG